jgi:N-acetylated-alpha-linked acidic dipeptidase
MEGYIAPVWDVIGVINGTNPEDVVIVGNHRDAWVIGGAADPNSGSALLIELANAFGKLLAKGWKPRRTMWVIHHKSIAVLLIRCIVF